MKPLPLFLCLLLCGCATPKPMNGIPNLSQVSTGIWRGGQPTLEGWFWLKQHGVTNVIKLNPEYEASDQPAVALGFNVQAYPIDTMEMIFGHPKPWNTLVAAKAINRRPVYIHCAHGQDRTGIVIGIYRVMHDGWTKAQAKQEMIEHGFSPELHGLYSFWEEEVK